MKYAVVIIAILVTIVTGYFYITSEYGVSLVPSNPASRTLVNFTFEDGMQGWSPISNVKVLHETDVVHSGKYALQVKGDSPIGVWAVATSKHVQLKNNTPYRFSGWIKVDSISSADASPKIYLKVGMYLDHKWYRNFYSKEYDLGHLGSWEYVSADFRSPEEGSVDFNVNVDKRTSTKDVYLISYIDDLRIETL